MRRQQLSNLEHPWANRDRNAVVANYATTAAGKTYHVDYYNLDVIISVGYRMKSQRGVQFRIWAINIKKVIFSG